jgi:hypothetical protein
MKTAILRPSPNKSEIRRRSMNTEIIETRPATRLLAEEAVREIFREKFNDSRHWLLIIRGSAALMMTEIEDRFYAGEKITCTITWLIVRVLTL